MPLPSVPLPRSTVVVGTVGVAFRALTRAEALRLPKLKDDADESEAFIIAQGTDSPIQEARDWRQATSMSDVGRLVNAIIVLSGLATEEQLADPLGASATGNKSSESSLTASDPASTTS